MKFAGVDSSAVGVRCFPQIGQYIADGDSQTVRLPGRDGELFLSATQGAAEFPITVRADAANAAASRTLLDGVAAWLSRGPAQLVFDELPDRYWTARLRGGLAWSLGAGSYRVVSNIVMRADDPHAYALTDDTAVLTAPGTVARTKGNAPSRPTVWVTGTLTSGQSVTLNLWSKTVTLTGPLSAGEVALLDYRDYTFRVVALTWTEVARNIATNPSFESTGANVEVVRNMVPNTWGTPILSTSGWELNARWFGASPSAGAVSTVTETVTLPDGTEAPSYRRKTWTNVSGSAFADIAYQFFYSSSIRASLTAGVMHTLQFAWRRSWSAAPTACRLNIKFYNAASGGSQVGSTQLQEVTAPPANTWQQDSTTFTAPAGATHCEIYMQYDAKVGDFGAGATLDITAVCVTEGDRRRPFGPGYSPDPDMEAVAVGTVGASATILQAPVAAGVNGAPGVDRRVISSTRWASSGTRSIRVIPLRGVASGGGATIGGLTVADAGKTYTILATARLREAQTGPLVNARRIAVAFTPDTGWVTSDQPPNEPGVYPIRLVVNIPSGITANPVIRLIGGAVSGDVWWDDLTIVEGVYDGPPFNGRTVSDSPSRSYTWVGTPDASASIARSLTGMTPIRNLAGKLSNLARINCPVGGGPVSWTTTGSISQVAIACNSRWI